MEMLVLLKAVDLTALPAGNEAMLGIHLDSPNNDWH